MPRAAPGENARGAVRRKIPDYLVVPENYSERRHMKCPYRSGMEIFVHPPVSQCDFIGYFTQQLSGFGVGCGRLGEVVSLVGDCRPPPPGNPHRPSNPETRIGWNGWVALNPVNIVPGDTHDHKMTRTLGGFSSPICMKVSFNKHKKRSNLKNLKSSEYFKEKCSYFSCTENIHVLEFVSFHSHLCGSLEVKPLSIAITNVLES